MAAAVTIASPPAHTNDTQGARRIAAAFSAARREERAALIAYIVAGYPDAETSFELAVATIDAGADILEIGLPYSDPLADGTTLQRASHAALQAGSTLDGSLALVRRVARARPDIPLVTMGYANQLIGGGDGRKAEILRAVDVRRIDRRHDKLGVRGLGLLGAPPSDVHVRRAAVALQILGEAF